MKKWKLAAFLILQAFLAYVVFIATIHSPKSTYRQVQETLGARQQLLQAEQAKLNAIIAGSFEHPTSVTIERVIKNAKPVRRQNALDALSADDVKFLTDAANGK